MSDLEARQARPATGPMKDYRGPQIPARQEQARAETAVVKVERAIRQARKASARHLMDATGLSEGSVSNALRDLRATKKVQTHQTASGQPNEHEWLGDLTDLPSYDEQRADQIGQNGNDGEHYGVEDDEPAVAVADHPDNDCDSGAAMASSNGDAKCQPPTADTAAYAELARRGLGVVEGAIQRMESASKTGIQPLPYDDYRIEAMRRLVPLVAPDIGEAINELIEHVTGKEAA
ncbi:MAG: hypothetical protein U5L08_04290 [Xanthomonadales bacterium]|nr:hypothetical protein [Xanthomonadales bacterium]